MALYERIMVAVDFSSYSQFAVNHGVELARLTGAALILVNVLHQRDVATVERVLQNQSEFSPDDYIASRREERLHKMQVLVDKAGGSDLAVEKIVVVGLPHAGLLEQIEEQRADLLLINTKGRSNLADAVIGSCARKMYRHCPVPLLSLRPEKLKP